MEVPPAAAEDFDKENVAPPVSKNASKMSGTAHGIVKPSDDDSTDCFIVESSNSAASARNSPIPMPLSSAALAQVEGQETAESGGLAKKKRKKKKKKKKKVKQNGAEPSASAASAHEEEIIAEPCGDSKENEPERKPKDDDNEMETKEDEQKTKEDDMETKEAEQEMEAKEAEQKMEAKEAEQKMDAKEAEQKMEAKEAEQKMEAKEAEQKMEVMEGSAVDAAEVKEDEESKVRLEMREEAEQRPSESGRLAGWKPSSDLAACQSNSHPLSEDTAVLVVVPAKRRNSRGCSSSDSEMEHEARPFYDEEYVTVDEEGPGPLATVPEMEDGELEEDVAPDATEEVEPFVVPSEEVMQRVVKQMEFYFSDANILKDYFLLRRIRKNRGGWVRIALLAGFKLVQSITKDARQVAYAIKHKSTLLETDEADLRVRRRGGLPEWDHHVYKRTCLLYGFDRHPPRKGRKQSEPDNVSVHFVRQNLFSQFDANILLVRILKPGKEVPLDLKTCVRNHPQLGQELCVVAEFDTVSTAEAARSAVDGRRWNQSHRLWAKILGKRPRLPEEWAARFGAHRSELLQQQQHRQQQGRAGHRDANYRYHQELEHYQQQQRMEQLYYQQQQQKFLEQLQRRRWTDRREPVSYADSVRGKKRPAPESYADKVRSSQKNEQESGACAAAEGEREESEKAAARPEKRKLVPKLRGRRSRRSHGEETGRTAKTTEEAPAKPTKPPKPSSYAAAAASGETAAKGAEEATTAEESKSGTRKARERHGRPSDPKKDGATQTSGPLGSPTGTERKARAGLVLVREPRGPLEGASAPTWIRNGVSPASEEAVAPESVSADSVAASEEPEQSGTQRKGSSLTRRRSVRELVRQFEALTTTTNDGSDGDHNSGSSTPRRVSTDAVTRSNASRDSLATTPLPGVMEQ